MKTPNAKTCTEICELHLLNVYGEFPYRQMLPLVQIHRLKITFRVSLKLAVTFHDSDAFLKFATSQTY